MFKQDIKFLTTSGSVLRHIGAMTVVASIGSAGLVLSAAQAEDFVVNEATTVTNGDAARTIDGGDSLTVEKGGGITTSATNTPTVSGKGTGKSAANTPAVSGTGSGNKLVNKGAISGSGLNSHGLSVTGDQNIVLNTGSVETSGTGGRGLQAIGSDNVATNEGSIEVSGASGDGMMLQGDRNKAINRGTIKTFMAAGSSVATTAARHGIASYGALNQVINEGEIIVNANGGNGILLSGDNNSGSNYGSIETLLMFSPAVYIDGMDNQFANYGNIKSTSPSSDGIVITKTDNRLINKGTVETLGGPYSNAINIEGSESTVDNGGTLKTRGSISHGILVNADISSEVGNSNTISNNGSILVYGSEALGIFIYANADGNTITNTGRIVSKQEAAIGIDDRATNTAVNLHTGGFLVGDVDMGTSGGPDTSTNALNIHTNRAASVMWRVRGYMKDKKPGAVGSVPVFFSTDVEFSKAVKDDALHHAAVYDPTALAGSINMLGTLSGNVSALVQSRFDGDETGNTGWWMGGLFSSGSYDKNTVMLDYDLDQYSGAIGYDTEVSGGMKLGGMIGYGTGTMTADGRWIASHDNKASGLFGAFYARNQVDNMFVDLALSGGRLSHSDKRFVNDNTVAGGLATAKADYDSWWVAPELGVGFDLENKSGPWQLTPSARVRYARQSIDGFTETGIATASGNAKLASRSIGMLETRLEMAASTPLENLVNKRVDSGKITLRAGWQMRRAMGDEAARVSLLGETKTVSYKTDNKNSAYAGGTVSMKLDNGVALNLGGEFNVGSGVQNIRATFGLKKAF